MAANVHWKRWIFASASNFMKAELSPPKTNPALAFSVEGQGVDLKGDYAEFRMSGPSFLESTNGIFHGTVIINVLVKAVKDGDFYKIHRMTGMVQAAFGKCIPIRKYGNTPGVDDKNVIIGELQLTRRGDNDTDTTDFGQLEPSIPSIQSTVEALYKTVLINNQ